MPKVRQKPVETVETVETVEPVVSPVGTNEANGTNGHQETSSVQSTNRIADALSIVDSSESSLVAETKVCQNQTVDTVKAKPWDNVPEITSPEWQDFVISQFNAADLDKDNNPGAEAARVVVGRILGPIIEERVEVCQVPSASNDYRSTVKASVRIAWKGDRDDLRIFEDVSDVYPGNCNPDYARFPSQSAKTKAMGRAYKSALQLKKVYTSEEMASGELSSVETASVPLINLSQQRFIDKVCRELNINLMRFINTGRKGDSEYKDIIQVPASSADRMIKTLADYQRNVDDIPTKIRGYNGN